MDRWEKKRRGGCREHFVGLPGRRIAFTDGDMFVQRTQRFTTEVDYFGIMNFYADSIYLYMYNVYSRALHGHGPIYRIC